jgi:CRP-like cAMP-binding protein
LPYPLSNVLLDSLPESDRRVLMQQIQPVALPVTTSLYEPNEVPKYVHFLTSGIASIVISTTHGATTEVAAIGREGAPQGLHLLGPVPITTSCFMQIAGTGLRVRYEVLERLFYGNGAIRRAILTYAQYQSALLGQVAGCNRLHEVEKRLARWFLMMQDRTGDSVLPLTQDFISQMIGNRRTTVSTVVGSLQKRGLISFARGRIEVVDRAGLGGIACECYSATRTMLGKLYSVADQTVWDGMDARAQDLEHSSLSGGAL